MTKNKKKKEKNDAKKSKLVLTLVVLSIFLLFLVFISSWVRKITTIDKEELGSVLGEKFEQSEDLSVTPQVEQYIRHVLEQSLTGTKEKVSEKAVEVEQSIMKVIEKEISNLTTSQIEALKYQICKDLGVISPEPSKEAE